MSGGKYSHLPEELRKSSRWVNYKTEEVDGRKNCKVPYSARTKRRADVTNANDWARFEDVIASDPERIGLVIGMPFVGIDLDKCIDSDTGAMQEWAQRFIDSLPETYRELSPSGCGLHLWYRCDDHGKLPDGHRAKKIEVYARKRYMTVTGQRYKGATSKLASLSLAEAESIYDRLDAKRAEKSEAIASTGAGFKEDQQLALLMKGKIVEAGFCDPTGDSDADFRLCSILAKKLNGNRDVIKQIWLNSGLKREKLGRPDYVDRTLDRVLELWKKNSPKYDGDGSDWEGSFPSVSSLDDEDLTAKDVVEYIIAEESVTLLSGYVANYKTFGALELCRAMLSGEPAFDHFKVQRSPELIYVVPEMGRKLFLKYARWFGLNGFGNRFRHRTIKDGPIIALDDPRLRCAVNGRVLILDTMGYFTKANDEKAAEQFLWFSQECRYLIEVCKAVAIVILHHPTKAGARSTEIDITEFIRGSGAIAGLIDTAFAFRRHGLDSPLVRVERLKGRPWESKLQPFILTSRDEEANSYLSQGRFPVWKEPGQAGMLSDHLPKKAPGRKAKNNKNEIMSFIRGLEGQGITGIDKLLVQIRSKYDEAPSRATLGRWLEAERDPF